MRFLYLAILLITIYSCEKRIDFTPATQEPKLVVEAVIENSQHPVVYLTRSLDFFSRISREQLTGSFVRNAEVTISDGVHTETLKEYEVPIASDTVLYYYTTDTARGNSALTGELGKAYHLTIKTTDGNEYTSTTTIPYLTKKPLIPFGFTTRCLLMIPPKWSYTAGLPIHPALATIYAISPT